MLNGLIINLFTAGTFMLEHDIQYLLTRRYCSVSLFATAAAATASTSTMTAVTTALAIFLIFNHRANNRCDNDYQYNAYYKSSH